MTNEEAKEFGNYLIPFGKYAGTRIDKVPLDYLLWIDSGHFLAYIGFRENIHRYILSERIQREQEE